MMATDKTAIRTAFKPAKVFSRWTVCLCLIACSGGPLAAATAEPTTLTVDLTDDKFVPDHLVFHHGTRYRLHLTNSGKHLHEFTAPKFFANAIIENPTALSHNRGEVVLQPGETKDVLLTSRKRGAYELKCADHDWEGMVGSITVD